MSQIIDLTSDLSEPVFNGLRGNSVIRGGIDVDIAKSAFQKAIRRGDYKLAWTMGLRLNEFLYISNGKPIRSNLINRLSVIAGEDIGLANLDIIVKVDNYIDQLRKCDDRQQCEKLLLEVITLICASKKSRLVSHVNAVYYQALTNFQKMLDQNMLIVQNLHVDNSFYSEVEDLNDKTLLNKIKWLLENAKVDDEKMGTWYYMKMLIQSTNKYKISRGFPKKRNISSPPIFFVWNILLTHNSSIMSTLYKFYLNENENHIYIILGLLTWFYKPEKHDLIDISKIIDENGGEKSIIFKAMNDEIQVPEYAIDKHTKKGRINGKDTKTFAKEGAVIYNKAEWMDKWNHLEEIYMKVRGVEEPNLDGTGIESDYKITDDHMKKIISSPKGQVLTSSWKKYVYMPLNENFVYKGPWKIGESSTKKEKEKLKKLKFRFEVIKQFSNNVLTGDVIEDERKNLWLRYPLLSSINSDKWIIKTTYDKITNNMIDIVDRKSIGCIQLSFFSNNYDTIYEYMFGEKILYNDFILLYLLEVGDTGLYNVLLKENMCYIIDIDDDTTKTEFTELWNIFGRKPSETVVDVINKGIVMCKDKILENLKVIEEKIDIIKSISEKYKFEFNENKMLEKIKNVKDVICK